jgi:hypothetical protein
MWSGLDLKPRNLFDRTPFYPYTPVPPAVQADRRNRSGEDEAAPAVAPAADAAGRPDQRR